MYALKQQNVFFNLCMMIVAWIAASYTFNLLNFFVKYMPGDIYFNNILAGLSCFALLIQGKVEDILKPKGGIIVSFFIALVTVGGLMLFDADT